MSLLFKSNLVEAAIIGPVVKDLDSKYKILASFRIKKTNLS